MKRIIECNNLIRTSLAKVNLKVKIDPIQIAVIGAQSSGKTSVLEMILGVDCLPRGSGIVTKCPLILQLHQTNENTTYGVFGHKTDQIFSDMDGIRKEIEEQTLFLVGDKQTVSDKEILLDFYSKNVPDLTLIDLPGLVTTAMDGQDEGIEKKITNLARKFVQSEKTIILLINPANNDMANNPAIKLVQEVDKDRLRTFGVITKVDSMDAGQDATYLLQGNDFNLNHGYIAVKCRSQRDNDEQLLISDAKMREKEYFEEHPVYSKMLHKVGTENLSNKLSALLARSIKENLPYYLKNVKENIAICEKELKLLGKGSEFKDEGQAYEYFIQAIGTFIKQLSQNIEGADCDLTVKSLSGGSYIKKHFESFGRDLIDTIDPFEDIEIEQILIEMKKSFGINSNLFIPEDA
jgi:dynamin 1-like protein